MYVFVSVVVCMFVYVPMCRSAYMCMCVSVCVCVYVHVCVAWYRLTLEPFAVQSSSYKKHIPSSVRTEAKASRLPSANSRARARERERIYLLEGAYNN